MVLANLHLSENQAEPLPAGLSDKPSQQRGSAENETCLLTLENQTRGGEKGADPRKAYNGQALCLPLYA